MFPIVAYRAAAVALGVATRGIQTGGALGAAGGGGGPSTTATLAATALGLFLGEIAAGVANRDKELGEEGRGQEDRYPFGYSRSKPPEAGAPTGAPGMPISRGAAVGSPSSGSVQLPAGAPWHANCAADTPNRAAELNYTYGSYVAPTASCDLPGQAGPAQDGNSGTDFQEAYDNSGQGNLGVVFRSEGPPFGLDQRYIWISYGKDNPDGYPAPFPQYRPPALPYAPGVPRARIGALPGAGSARPHPATAPVAQPMIEDPPLPYRDRVVRGSYSASGGVRGAARDELVGTSLVTRYSVERAGFGVHERKVRAVGAYVAASLFGQFSEVLDITEAIWKALPLEVRTTGYTVVRGKPVAHPHFDAMAWDIYKNYMLVDMNEAIRNIVIDNFRDLVIGKSLGPASRGLSRAIGAPIGVSFGPAF